MEQTDQTQLNRLFEQIYRDNYEKISRYCFYQVKNKSDTEDLVSDTFARAYQYLGRFQGEMYSAWLYQIARNLINDRYRRTNRYVDGEKILEYIGSDTDIEENVIKNDEYKQVIEILELLKKEYREVLILKYVNEMEYPEIAQILGKTENATRLLVFKALKIVRKYAGR
ncbi:MAG: RNA polymerase sigma factor [bacterium]